jgi:hypothetical protein
MPEISLPCNCLLRWDETELSLIICVKHLDNYIDTISNLHAIEFIKMVANPRGSRFTSKIAMGMR